MDWFLYGRDHRHEIVKRFIFYPVTDETLTQLISGQYSYSIPPENTKDLLLFFFMFTGGIERKY